MKKNNKHLNKIINYVQTKTSLAYDKLSYNDKKILIIWLTINGLIPAIFSVIVSIFNFEISFQLPLALIIFGLLCISNIRAAFYYTKFRWLFIIIIPLNIIALIFVGEISFITSLPNIPFVIKTTYLLWVQ